MSVLDRLIRKAGLVEIDRVEVAVNADRAWNAVGQLDLAQSTLVRALFGFRTIPDRLAGKKPELRLRLEDLISTPASPGFQILAADPPREIAVGAIGKVWRPAIPFVHVPDAAAFAGFAQDGYIKVAWALRVVRESDQASQVEFELRVVATDDDAWKKFLRYFRLIGPGAHFIRRVLLAQLERDLGTPESEQNNRALPGDELILDALGQFTHSIVIAAPPARIWPWLVQMGCRRAGFTAWTCWTTLVFRARTRSGWICSSCASGTRSRRHQMGMTISRFFDCRTIGFSCWAVCSTSPTSDSSRSMSLAHPGSGRLRGPSSWSRSVHGTPVSTRERVGHSLRANVFTRSGFVRCTT